MNRRRLWWVIVAVAVLGGYWLLPIYGRVVVMRDDVDAGLWPQFRLDPPSVRSVGAQMVRVTDVKPWPFVLLTVDGEPATQQGTPTEHAGTWTWTWTFPELNRETYTLIFYHDCHTGCQERGRLEVGAGVADSVSGLPTKLGLVMPRLDRDWHDRAGWAVEVTYAMRPEEPYWGVDDLAARVASHRAKGLRVLIRVEYEQLQTLPPTGDYVALTEYLAFVRRLARDERFNEVYGYIIGSDFNTTDAVKLAPDRPISPMWYARIFGGYGEEPTHTDNVVQTVRSENPLTRVIVGPLRPWTSDVTETRFETTGDVPWLAYMDELVGLLDEAARTKAEAGVALAGPDGFDVQAPGSPDASEMGEEPRSEEPRRRLARDQWAGAQAGFRIYEDWLQVINAYPATRGLPVYIVSTNTYDRLDDTPPAQNYPAGWLTTALEVVSEEPQIKALVWFLDDFPHGDEWDYFSLTEQPGRLVDAAEEFDSLLRER